MEVSTSTFIGRHHVVVPQTTDHLKDAARSVVFVGKLAPNHCVFPTFGLNFATESPETLHAME